MLYMECICPNPWCPQHARDRWGHELIIDDPDSPAFCPECGHDVLPVGVCKTDGLDQ